MQNQKEKLIIFDLDGTLLNTIDDICYSMNLALNELGYQANYANEQMKQFVGSGALVLAKRALVKYGITDEKKIEILKNHYNLIYAHHNNVLTRPYDGIIDVLQRLKDDGYYLAVFSNKPNNDTQNVVEYYFGDAFDIVRGQLDDVPCKPHPEGVKLIINHFSNITIDDVFYVGDSDIDMQTGINAKVKTIGVTYGFRTLDTLLTYKPFAIAKLPYEIYQIINHYNN